MSKEEVSKKEEALKILQEEERNNLVKCSEEITASLKKYGYQLDIQQTIALKKI